MDLLGIAYRKRPAAVVEAVFQPDADVSAHGGGHGDHRHLMAAGGQYREAVVVTEELVGDAFHVRQVLRIRTDAAEHAEDELDEEVPGHQAAVAEMRQRIEMADVITFKLEASAAALAKPRQDEFHVGEGVLEDGAPRCFKKLRFPFVFPLRRLVERRKQSEVHRPHVQRTHFRFGAQRSRKPIFQRHQRRTAGGDVYYRIGRLLDARQELHEQRRIGRRAAVFRVPCMEMQDGSAGLGCSDCFGGDLVGGNR
ncbi:hypothetical protein D9M68_562600 [compost metagenome]